MRSICRIIMYMMYLYIFLNNFKQSWFDTWTCCCDPRSPPVAAAMASWWALLWNVSAAVQIYQKKNEIITPKTLKTYIFILLLLLNIFYNPIIFWSGYPTFGWFSCHGRQKTFFQGAKTSYFLSKFLKACHFLSKQVENILFCRPRRGVSAPLLPSPAVAHDTVVKFLVRNEDQIHYQVSWLGRKPVSDPIKLFFLANEEFLCFSLLS